MATPIIEKDPRPEVAPKNQDGDVIVLSAAQHNCFLAKPEDFQITEDKGVPAHNQCGRNESEYRKLLQKSAAVKGKSPFRSKPE
jgi:hypothetical protein